MTVRPTAGIAAAWSAAKASPNQQPVRLASDRQATAGQAREAEPKKGPPAPEGQGTQVDVRV
jgi:hypothetical protein